MVKLLKRLSLVIKKKCKDCGTLEAISFNGDCPTCDSASGWWCTCDEHQEVIFRSEVLECPICVAQARGDSGKDPSKEEEFLLACEEVEKKCNLFVDELISYLWGITDTGPRQKKIKDQVAAQWKLIDELFLSWGEKKSLYEKYMECKSGKQKIEEWRSDNEVIIKGGLIKGVARVRSYISIQRRPRGALPGPKNQRPLTLTIIQTAAAISDYFADEQFRLHGYNIDKFTVK